MELTTKTILNTNLSCFSKVAVSLEHLAVSHDRFTNKYTSVGVTFTMI